MTEIRKWVATIGRLDIGVFMRMVSAIAAARERNGAARHAPRSTLHASRHATRALYKSMRQIAARDPIAIADLVIDGDDLRMAGIPPGPWVGKILKTLLDAVLVDPTNNRRDWLLQEAQRLYQH